MRYRCPRCGQIYEEMTPDGMCERSECFGMKLVEYTGEGEDTHDRVEGLCLLVCDASFSMDEAAFPNNYLSKLGIVTKAVCQAVSDLKNIARPECVFIGIMAFGGRAALIPDKQGKSFVLSLREIHEQFGDSLDKYLYECLKNDKAGVDRRYTDFMAPLNLAREIYDAALSGDLSRFGIDKIVHMMMMSDIVTHDKRIMTAPNVRVMLYSDGEHNPQQSGALVNPFEPVEPSPLITVFIGEVAEGIHGGADQLKELANTCPAHGIKGYFLLNSPSRYALLRGIFRMAAGAAGFCPLCLKPLVIREEHV